MKYITSGDCNVVMPNMQNDCVHLILTDPPYFIDGMGDDWDSDKLAQRTSPNGVIKSLPAGMKFDVKQGKKLQNFMNPIAVEWMRIIKPGGFVLCFSQNRLAHHMTMAIESAGFEIRDTIAWSYEGQAKAFTQDHFIKKRNCSEEEKDRLIKKLDGRKTPQLKPQYETIILAQAPRDGTFVDNWDQWETGLIDISNPHLDSNRFPGTIINVSKPKNRHGHMTAKPVDLLRHLVRIFSVETGTVFDPFSGSGSTGVASLLENRKFLGIEIDDKMATYADARIDRKEI